MFLIEFKGEMFTGCAIFKHFAQSNVFNDRILNGTHFVGGILMTPGSYRVLAMLHGRLNLVFDSLVRCCASGCD